MDGSLKPYFSLIEYRGKHLALFVFSFGVVLALVTSSILVGIDWLTFGRYLFLSVFSMLATALSVYIYNDLTDIEIDRLNKLDRPLVTGQASRKDARNLIIILGIIGLTTAFTINLGVFLLMLTYFVLFSLYSFPPVRLKSRFLVNKITIVTGYALAYFIGGATVGTIPAAIFLMAALSYISGISASIVLDLRDIKGDESQEVKTVPIVWGPILTVRLALALVFSVAIATVAGYSQLGFNLAFPILACCGFSAWIYVLCPLFRHWNEPSFVENTIHKKIAPIGFLLQILTALGAVL